MKNKTHELIDRESAKIVRLILKGKTLISETGKPDKLRITEKVFESTDEAEKNFYKKEWASLKKGSILYNENANIGEAILHKFIGGYYTGALSFAQTVEGIYIYKSNGFDCKDSLVLIDNQGNELSEITLPKDLAWNIEYRSTTNSLLFDLDHYVFEYKIDNNAFDNIGQSKKPFTASFVSVANDKIAFATDGKITIVDNDNNILQTMEYETETIKGSTPFSGRLSKDGSLLALHNKMGEIQIIDTSNCNVIKEIHSDFNMVDKMEFSNDNSLLIFNEEYGTRKMRYFDIDKNTEIEFKGLEIPEYSKDVNNFCFNEDQSKLVLVQRSTAYVYDFIAKKLLCNFDIEHLIKGCSVKFIENDKLAIRTDYACFSIYRI